MYVKNHMDLRGCRQFAVVYEHKYIPSFCENIGMFVFEVWSQVDRVSTCFNSSFYRYNWILCSFFVFTHVALLLGNA